MGGVKQPHVHGADGINMQRDLAPAPLPAAAGEWCLGEWFTAQQLAGMPGLPGTEFGVRKAAQKNLWPTRPKVRGKGVEYPYAALPDATRRHIDGLRWALVRAGQAADAAAPAIARALTRDVSRYISARSDLAEFARDALADSQKSEDVWLGFVGDQLAGVIDRDTRDYLILLRADGVRHVQKEHGDDAGKQRPPVPEDYTDAGKWLLDGRIDRAETVGRMERVKVVYETGGERKISIWEVRPGRQNRALVMVTLWVER